MGKSSKNESGGGIGLFGAMFLVLLVLKLTGFIDWSWWLVTAPLWAPPVIVLTIAAVIFVTSYLYEEEGKNENQD